MLFLGWVVVEYYLSIPGKKLYILENIHYGNAFVFCIHVYSHVLLMILVCVPNVFLLRKTYMLPNRFKEY